MEQKSLGTKIGTTSYGKVVVLAPSLQDQDAVYDWLFEFQAQEIVEIYAMLEYLVVWSTRNAIEEDEKPKMVRKAIEEIERDDPDAFRRIKIKLGLRASTDYVKLGAKLISAGFAD